MKKLLVLAALSSSMVFAVDAAVVTPGLLARAKTSIVAVSGKALTAVRSAVVASAQQTKKHYVVAGTVVTVAAVATLYCTNANFKAKVNSVLGLDAKN